MAAGKRPSLRRRAVLAAAASGAALAAAHIAWAQSGAYPNKRVRILVGLASLQSEPGIHVRALRWRQPNLNDVFLWVAEGKA